jgi:hypothetical protein
MKGNSKANRLDSAIRKARSLKEIKERLSRRERNVKKCGPCVEKIAHQRRLVSFTVCHVQHIEHMFMVLFLLPGSPGGDPKALFSILNKYSILGTYLFCGSGESYGRY